jgi:hypothetical protein
VVEEVGGGEVIDMKDDPKIQCGYGWLSLPTDSVFTPSCSFHDGAYLNDSRHQQLYSRKLIDDTMHNQLLVIAGSSRFLRAQAHIMYAVTRMFGWLFWEGKR